jgi:hypothetical protein
MQSENMNRVELISRLSEAEGAKLVAEHDFEFAMFLIEKLLESWSIEELREAWKEYGKAIYKSYIEDRKRGSY